MIKCSQVITERVNTTMKRKHGFCLLTGLLAVVLLACTLPALANEARITVTTGVSVYLDGVKLNLTDATGKAVDAFVSEGTTYVPVRAIGEALGLTVGWDGASRNVSLTGTPRSVVDKTAGQAGTRAAETKTIAIDGGITITLNGRPLVPKDANGKVVDVFASEGTTYLPLRAVTEALGLKVDWDGNTRGVYLYTAGSAVPAKGTLVASAPAGDPLAHTITKDSVCIQDLRDFANATLTVDVPQAASGYQVQPFNGDRSAAALVEEYVKTICSGGYNLKLIDSHYQAFNDGFTSASWAIDYTGTGRVAGTTKSLFNDVECNVTLYYTIDYGRLKGQLWIPASMDIVDLGLRYGGGKESISVAGPSAMAGLYRMPDGSYQTSDGRLSTTPGRATVLRDGISYSVDAQFERNSKDVLWVRNFYRDEGIYFCTPESRVMTGDIFTLRDMLYNNSWTFRSLNEFDQFRHDTPFLGLGHNNDFITPRVKQSLNEFDALTVRVMYWEPNAEAVYYIYAELSTTPYTVEALCAVNLTRIEGFSGRDDERLVYAGQSIQLDSPREYGANYELFTWELVEGAGVVELSGTNTAACTVKALRTGTAVVRVNYNYGVDEPDVLTGIKRNADHTQTVDYYIHVQQG